MKDFDSKNPTADEINCLPENMRSFIHDLITRCDPAGDVAGIAFLRDRNE